MSKIVGTAAPLSCLWESGGRSKKPEAGTTAAGIVFLGWLKATGQKAWQLLPLSETHLEPGSRVKRASSPYQGYGIGFGTRYLPPAGRRLRPTRRQWSVFVRENRGWLDDYSLFAALAAHFGTDDWTVWEAAIRDREPQAMRRWRRRLDASWRREALTQWRLRTAFLGLRAAASAAGVELIGDLPFYLPNRSPLVWAHRECFDLDRNGRSRAVSGVPDGPRSHFGRQVWGHPLYDWRRPARVLRLWRLRLDFYAGFYDLLRLDHAKGFFNFGAMDPIDPSRDAIRTGPGMAALRRVIASARGLKLGLFAEDAGDRLRGLRRTLRQLKIPGIRQLRFAYNEKRRRLERNYADVAAYPENCLVYTSTHDTETLVGYLRLLTAAERRLLCAHVGVPSSADHRIMARRLIGALVASPARRVIVPVQDWLGSTRRINIPGTEKPTADPNWRYRLERPIKKMPSLEWLGLPRS
ncbi:MAG: 4-alpha-glucanotransferase [Patescibacteria group bacterium]